MAQKLAVICMSGGVGEGEGWEGAGQGGKMFQFSGWEVEVKDAEQIWGKQEISSLAALTQVSRVECVF